MLTLWLQLHFNSGRRHPGELPKSLGSLLQWFAGLETDDLGRLIPTLSRLYDLSKLVRILPFLTTSSYMHQLVAPLKRRLESPLDMALAEICYYDEHRAYEQEGTKSDLLSSSRSTRLSSYSVLAVAADRQVLRIRLFSARN